MRLEFYSLSHSILVFFLFVLYIKFVGFIMNKKNMTTISILYAEYTYILSDDPYHLTQEGTDGWTNKIAKRLQ